MKAWFEYVLGISELFYKMKLQAYEDACASLVLEAAGVVVSAAVADGEGSKSAVKTENTAGCASLTSADDSATTERTFIKPLPATSATVDGQESGNSLVSRDTLPAIRRSAAPESELKTVNNSNECSAGQGTMQPQSSTALHKRSNVGRRGDVVGCLATPSHTTTSPVDVVSSLLEMMQLRKPIRATSTRPTPIDDIQAEADCVFQGLEDVFTLKPEDIAAAMAASPAALGIPGSSEAPTNPTDGANVRALHDDDAAAVPRRASPSPSSVPSAFNERYLLYGELTSLGIRQLQAISVASTCVVLEDRKGQHARETAAELPAVASSFSEAVTSVDGGLASHSSPNLSGLPSATTSSLHGATAGRTPRGAVVVAVDVGCGNGRLLFEWGRLAAATCQRRGGGSLGGRPTEGGWSTSATAATPQSALMSPFPLASAGGSAETPTVRKGGLLSAVSAPLAVASPAAVWRGWLGVGIELLPSRMRIARQALIPYYLNLKQTLLVPFAGDDPQQPAPIHLDPCPPETIAVNDLSASCSATNSFHSGLISHATTTTSNGTPVSANSGVAPYPTTRVQLTSARVLLYEGDALAPGVLSNATLCRFPSLFSRGELLRLREYHTQPDFTTSGVGGKELDGAGDPGTFPNPFLNRSYSLRSARPGTSHRRGLQTLLNESFASVTSNASSFSSSRGVSALQNYYRLCRVEGGPSLTGKEDPHLVVFCCGLGFDEVQVQRLCQRLEDMVLHPTATGAASGVPPPSANSDSIQHRSGRECGVVHQRGSSNGGGVHPDHTQCNPTANGGDGADNLTSSIHRTSPCSLCSEMNREDERETNFGVPLASPTVPEIPSSNTVLGISDDVVAYRHWKSVTCVLLLGPMDVLGPKFPLFRYARRVFDTQRLPIPAEDTGLLLSTGRRPNGDIVPCTMRPTPMPESPPGRALTYDAVESDAWNTTVEATWMGAAPAWVVRFCF